MKFFLTLITFFLLHNWSSAHTTPYYSIKDRTENADIIFEGEVLNSQCVWSDNEKDIYTKHTVRIDKIFKGNHSSNSITIYTKGGAMEDKFQLHSHSAFLAIGYKGLFFGNSSLYPEMTRGEHQGISLLYEESGFIQYTDNTVGVKAVDRPNYFQRIESVYDSIYLVTRQPYLLENDNGAFTARAVTCPPVPEPEITFLFENVEITGLGQYLEFDVLAKSSQNGVKFAGAELSIKYPTNVFGTNIVQAGLIEVQKEQIILNNNYTLTSTDISSDHFKIETHALQNNLNTYVLSVVKEKLCHVKINIQNIINVASITSASFASTGQASYFCDQNTYPLGKLM